MIQVDFQARIYNMVIIICNFDYYGSFAHLNTLL